MRKVQLRNSARVPARVHAHVLGLDGEPCGLLVVEPAAFPLPAHGCMDMELALTGTRLGPLEHVVSFTVRQDTVTVL